jgi:hypothetical protein
VDTRFVGTVNSVDFNRCVLDGGAVFTSDGVCSTRVLQNVLPVLVEIFVKYDSPLTLRFEFHEHI